jgi:hypothetical protein
MPPVGATGAGFVLGQISTYSLEDVAFGGQRCQRARAGSQNAAIFDNIATMQESIERLMGVMNASFSALYFLVKK